MEIIIVLGLLYVLPTIIAFGKNHKRKWDVAVLNICGGLTGIGWVTAFIGAVWDS
jgi:hypothetical protein